VTVVVLGIDALDPEIVDPELHPNLTLDRYEAIGTIVSSAGDPSTHELWPTIITGLDPEDHGLQLDDGVAWENPLLRRMSAVGDYLLPETIQTKLGAWLLNNTAQDAFRVPSTYYEERGLSTVFDGVDAETIGIPNYVVDPSLEDREHQLRRTMGELFERDPDGGGRHSSTDAKAFYEQCMEMVMVRIARVRRAVRSRRHELVFGYTSGLDLIGHVSHDRPALQRRAYEEVDGLVGELLGDLDSDDVLLLVSDHGLQDGLHTESAMVASTSGDVIEGISHVRDVREAIERELQRGSHAPGSRELSPEQDDEDANQVREHLEDLGYM
jgi:predicted AlkP superfamily phosphohydrolase/phosphomutase